MESINVKTNKISITAINIVSIAVPLVVVILLSIPSKPDFGSWTKNLPMVNAVINSLTSFLLMLGYIQIKKGNRVAHKKLMTASFILGGLFLVFYVIYHLTNSSTKFGGEGTIKYFYYFILISHIFCSLIVLPLVLRAIFFAWNQDFKHHVLIVKYAWPIWLYVSVTGVLAYLLISPYYL